MRRMIQVALVALFCLTIATPAMALGTMGTSTGTHSKQSGTIMGTGTNNGYGYGNNLDNVPNSGIDGYGINTRMNSNGTSNGFMNGNGNGSGFMNGTGNGNGMGRQGYGTLDTNNTTGNRTGIRARSYTGGNVRGYATNNNDGNGSGWGWLGLLGLIGLAGMFSKGKDNDRSKI